MGNNKLKINDDIRATFKLKNRSNCMGILKLLRLNSSQGLKGNFSVKLRNS